jgi:hypothetical protein
MRIWTLHPKYLDRQGLLALWRETLLAQKVLKGQTKGYRHHPQLDRFKNHSFPLAAVAAYLKTVAQEAARRGYQFDQTKIESLATRQQIPVGRDQLLYEWEHLKTKLQRRDPSCCRQLLEIEFPEAHPMFELVDGPIEAWERSAVAKHL